MARAGRRGPPPGGRPEAEQVVYHDVGAVRLAETNVGLIGLDPFSHNGAGFFPGNTPNNYVFAAGTWLAAVGDVDGDGEADTLFIQSHNPVNRGSEYRPGTRTQDPSDPLARLFVSTVAADLEVWPGGFRTEDTDTNSPTYGQIIPSIISDQDIVGTYTTVGAMPHFATPSPPLEVRQRGLAFTVGLASQAVIFIIDFQNISDEVGPPVEMRNAWMGYDMDPDIGDDFSDDRTSFFQQQITPEGDTARVDMGFAWDDDFEEMNFVSKPGFVGVAILQSPGNARDGIDNDRDGLVDESPLNGVDDDGNGAIDDQPDEVDQLGLIYYSMHNDPSVPGPREDPQDDNQGYRIMSCTPPTECAETTAKTDVRYMIDSGPFQILPGETHRVIFAFVFANSSDPEITSLPVVGNPPRPDPNHPALAEFLAVRKVVQGVYDLGFIESPGPPPPDLQLIPGDGQVTILWEDWPLGVPDPAYAGFVELDSTYRRYDFEGFRVWRSRTGNFSRAGDLRDPLNPVAEAENRNNPALDLTLLAQYDLADGITDEDGIVVTDSVVHPWGSVEVVRADTFRLGSDTGLKFSFVDRGDPGMPLVNGFRYYYAVTSYDYNSPRLPGSRLSSETPLSFSINRSAIPRSEPSTFGPADRTAFLHVSPEGELVDETSSTVDTIVTLAEFREDSLFVRAVYHTPWGDSTLFGGRAPTVRTRLISPSGDTLQPEEILAPVDVNVASNALLASTFTPIQHERIRTGSHALVLRDLQRAAGLPGGQIRITCGVVDEATGQALPAAVAGSPPGEGVPPAFDLVLDGTDQIVLIQVFDDSVSGGILYETTVTFNTDVSSFQQGRREDIVPIHLLAYDGEGNPIAVGEVKDVARGEVIPEFLRASDIEILWENTGTVVRPQRVFDLDNRVPVAFARPETTVVGGDTAVAPGEKGSNWAFLRGSGVVRTEDFVPLPLGSSLQLYLSGVRIIIVGPVAPQTGDRWILRQAALDRRLLSDVTDRDSVHVETETQSIDSISVDRIRTWRPLPARRPPVPGTRYRMVLQGGGLGVGRPDLGEIRAVPNPYLGLARFEMGPEDRQLHFVNLPGRCTIRVYTIAGNLVRVLEHEAQEGGTEVWDLETREGLPLASGNYYYHVTTPEGRTHLGRFAVIR